MELIRSDDGNPFLPVNKYFYTMSQRPGINSTVSFPYIDASESVPRGFCENTIYSEEAMNKLLETPPVTLVQDYYSCSKTPIASLKDSVGNAAGLASMVTQGVMFILGIVAVKAYNSWAQKKHGRPALMKVPTKTELVGIQARKKEQVMFDLLSKMSAQLSMTCTELSLTQEKLSVLMNKPSSKLKTIEATQDQGSTVSFFETRGIDDSKGGDAIPNAVDGGSGFVSRPHTLPTDNIPGSSSLQSNNNIAEIDLHVKTLKDLMSMSAKDLADRDASVSAKKKKKPSIFAAMQEQIGIHPLDEDDDEE